jgi:hypothetical protein
MVMTKPVQGWLKCEITEGMFPDEFGVIGYTTDKNMFSFFIHNSLVDEKEQMVMVSVNGCEDDFCYVLLPCEPYGHPSRMVKVPATSVKIMSWEKVHAA